MSALASAQRPFFFLIDFEMEKPIICPVEEAQELGFQFEIKGFRNFQLQDQKPAQVPLLVAPIPKADCLPLTSTDFIIFLVK